MWVLHQKPYVHFCSYHSKWISFVTNMRIVGAELWQAHRGKCLVCSVKESTQKNNSYFLMSISLHHQRAPWLDWVWEQLAGCNNTESCCYSSIAYKVDYGKKKKKILVPLRQKKQPEQATHPEASLYLNTHLDSVLGCVHHSKGCWSLHRTRCKDIVPAQRASKEQHGPTPYFYTQAGPHAMEGLDYFPTIPSLSYDHSAVISGTGCEVLRLVTEWPGHSFGPPFVSCSIPHRQEKKDPCNTYEAFVLPVSLQLRIIVSFRCQAPVICHPMSPKGGYVSPQVVCACVSGVVEGWWA